MGLVHSGDVADLVYAELVEEKALSNSDGVKIPHSAHPPYALVSWQAAEVRRVSELCSSMHEFVKSREVILNRLKRAQYSSIIISRLRRFSLFCNA